MEKRSLQEIGALYHSDPIKHKKKCKIYQQISHQKQIKDTVTRNIGECFTTHYKPYLYIFVL